MEQILDILSWVFLVAGSLFVVTGGIGLLRLPDFYTRVHAAGVTDTLGSWLILIGLLLQAGLNLVGVKLLILIAFLLLTSPLSTHALTKAAFLRGLEPIEGPQTRRGNR